MKLDTLGLTPQKISQLPKRQVLMHLGYCYHLSQEQRKVYPNNFIISVLQQREIQLNSLQQIQRQQAQISMLQKINAAQVMTEKYQKQIIQLYLFVQIFIYVLMICAGIVGIRNYVENQKWSAATVVGIACTVLVGLSLFRFFKKQ